MGRKGLMIMYLVVLVLLMYGIMGCSMVPFDSGQSKGAQFASNLTQIEFFTLDLPDWLKYQHHETFTFLPADQQGRITDHPTGFLKIRDPRWGSVRIIPVTGGVLTNLDEDRSRVSFFHEAWVWGGALLVARYSNDNHSIGSLAFQLFRTDSEEDPEDLNLNELLPPPPTGKRVIRAARVTWHYSEDSGGEDQDTPVKPAATLHLLTMDTATSLWREFFIPWEGLVTRLVEEDMAIAGPSVFTLDGTSELPRALHYLLLDEEIDEETHTRSFLTWQAGYPSETAQTEGVTWSSASPPGGGPAESLESLETELSNPLVWVSPDGRLFSRRTGGTDVFTLAGEETPEGSGLLVSLEVLDIGTLYAARAGLSADSTALVPWYTVVGISKAFGFNQPNVITVGVYLP